MNWPGQERYTCVVMTYLDGSTCFISSSKPISRQPSRKGHESLQKDQPYSIIKRIRTHATGAEKTGTNAEVTRTSMAMNLKDACIA